MQIYKNRRSITTVNKHLPFVWRVNYLHEAITPEIIARDCARKSPPDLAEESLSDGSPVAVLAIRAIDSLNAAGSGYANALANLFDGQ